MDKELDDTDYLAKRAKIDSILSLVNLPTELLIKILSYLPIRDKIKVRYICPVFRDVSKVPSLWKFIWPDYEPRHVCIVNNVLKVSGEHVRRLSFASHVGPEKILEMASYCTNVTHLSLPNHTKLNLGELEKVTGALNHLQQLDVFLPPWPGIRNPHDRIEHIEGFLRITPEKELKLHIDCCYLMEAVTILQNWADRGSPLPSVINILNLPSVTNILAEEDNNEAIDKLLEFWLASSSKLPSFEIALYDGNRVPMNLYPPMPLRRFQFGPTATPPFIRLSSHGIVGLKHDTFYLSEYDDYGKVGHTVTPYYHHEEHLTNCIAHIYSITNVDFSDVDVHSSHLEQLAIACPHLQRLNLKNNINCLTNLQGLHAVVHTCHNLQGLNLVGISASCVESCLVLWELLSSLKKLSHLVLNLCVMGPQGLDDSDKQKLISMLKTCYSLQALEIHYDDYFGRRCMGCNSTLVKDLLFSHFPSITQCRMVDFPYSVLNYAASNCAKLKYFYEHLSEFEDVNRLVSLVGNCHLQQLYIDLCVSPSDKWAYALSVHSELESVFLCVETISIRAIIFLVKNSPNLTLLQIIVHFPLLYFNKEVTDYTTGIKEMLLNCDYKLVAPRNFKVIYNNSCCAEQDIVVFNADMINTNLNSLWT